MRKILFATKNKGKIKEINAILEGTDILAESMEDAGFAIEIEETGQTFEENALIKARAICEVSHQITLADDSGLEIDYLGKKPGVHSARYLGENTSYDIKNKHILELLKDVARPQRTARFVSVIAAVFPNGKTFTCRGEIEGEIGYESKGENGFGYDPIFYVPEYNMTTAQMSPEQKNKVSHRGKALRAMKERLLEEWQEEMGEK